MSLKTWTQYNRINYETRIIKSIATNSGIIVSELCYSNSVLKYFWANKFGTPIFWNQSYL
jgi:hypothetical protein